MVVRIVIAGQSQCQQFAEVCMVADYLSKQLPSLSYERIEKSVRDWEDWLFKINEKHKWHHTKSPLVWKEILMKGSKPYYIGGASKFLEYCHCYYNFDSFLAPETFQRVPEILVAYRKKMAEEAKLLSAKIEQLGVIDKTPQNDFSVCISGAKHPLTKYLISALLDLSVDDKSISKICIFDGNYHHDSLEEIERECTLMSSKHYGKVVKYFDKFGMTSAIDLLIIMDHAPFDEYEPIGTWLKANRKIMENLSFIINASAARDMYILLPNLGPACYNATILSNLVRMPRRNIVVATADLGLEITSTMAEIAEVPLKNIYCPPVWGFVGINQLVDVNTTVHRYDSFQPYKRYLRVNKSTLTVGSLTPEVRTMEYLMYLDESLWKTVAANKAKYTQPPLGINKVEAVVDVVSEWLFQKNPDHIVSLGICCNGSFGLNFTGKFSQPSRFVKGEWVPASDYLLPKDRQIKLNYLEEMAAYTMTINTGDLPNLKPYYYPCYCKVSRRHRKKRLF